MNVGIWSADYFGPTEREQKAHANREKSEENIAKQKKITKHTHTHIYEIEKKKS